jgi:hypothetical protein
VHSQEPCNYDHHDHDSDYVKNVQIPLINGFKSGPVHDHKNTLAGAHMLIGRYQSTCDCQRRVEVVGYDNVQFSKAPNVLRGMGMAHLSKNAQAIKELAEKGVAPS